MLQELLQMEFSATFREYANLPVLNIIRQWASMFDPFTGVSPLKGNKFIPTSYKGSCYVLQTKPVGAFPNAHLTEEDVEEAWVFDGVWPVAVPFDFLNTDLATAIGQTLQVNFSYDGFPFTSSERCYCKMSRSLSDNGPQLLYRYTTEVRECPWAFWRCFYWWLIIYYFMGSLRGTYF